MPKMRCIYDLSKRIFYFKRMNCKIIPMLLVTRFICTLKVFLGSLLYSIFSCLLNYPDHYTTTYHMYRGPKVVIFPLQFQSTATYITLVAMGFILHTGPAWFLGTQNGFYIKDQECNICQILYVQTFLLSKPSKV
jgi:hypothetical protein